MVGVVDATVAVEDGLRVVGLDPRRIRAWPTQDQIGRLYGEVTVAADEYVATEAPDLELAGVKDLAGARARELDFLWRNWSQAGPVLAAAVPEGGPIDTGGSENPA